MAYRTQIYGFTFIAETINDLFDAIEHYEYDAGLEIEEMADWDHIYVETID